MKRNTISFFFLIVLIFVCAFQTSAWGISGEIYDELRYLIIGLVTVSFLSSYKGNILRHTKIPVFKAHFWGLVIFSFILILLYFLGLDPEWQPARDLWIALILLIIGLDINLSKRRFIKLINIYIIAYTVAALSIVFVFSSGFNIREIYLPVPKNQIAPSFGAAFILALYLGIKSSAFKRYGYFIFSGLLLASLLVLRGRSVMVGTFFSILLLVFCFIRSRRYKIVAFLIGFFLVLFIGQFIYESFFLNYDVDSINSFSAHRYDVYLMAFSFLKTNFIFGLLGGAKFTDYTIHNYVLYNLVNYGILISFVLFLIYIKYIGTLFKGIRLNKFEYSEIGLLPMVIIFVVSFFEYTYPYAPGSSIFFTFFLLGQYLRANYIVIHSDVTIQTEALPKPF